MQLEDATAFIALHDNTMLINVCPRLGVGHRWFKTAVSFGIRIFVLFCTPKTNADG